MKKDRLVANRLSRKELNDCVKISRIDGCNIKRVGNLEFDWVRFYTSGPPGSGGGACNTYQFDVEKILFCFGSSSYRQCHL